MFLHILRVRKRYIVGMSLLYLGMFIGLLCSTKYLFLNHYSITKYEPERFHYFSFGFNIHSSGDFIIGFAYQCCIIWRLDFALVVRGLPFRVSIWSLFFK
ncbi:MAG TPA: hypothetical protein VIQ00_04810 [Chitinophagaceae bacterium]